ncbi:MAG: lytic transglycosylase domain-containing protein [Myxococcales bacterium]|jgi:soluble lytic murein transglycosylase-like protein|nr:MAG: lytic transglycosylase domain-containing protein [Myxococcales bacterium]
MDVVEPPSRERSDFETAGMPEKSKRMAFAGLTVALSVLLITGAIGLWAAPADATRVQTPTRDNLIRLYHLEPYIAYFTSHPYGVGAGRVPADYIKALILSESAVDKFAQSTMGARGLTQILPSTGRKAGSRIAAAGHDFRYVDERALADLNPDLLYDPAVNILIACYLNAIYSHQYDGRIDLMAAAWNAGPDAVVRHGNRVPPYDETRTFVDRVLGYMAYFDQQKSS